MSEERIDHALHAERLLTRTRGNISGEPMPTAEDVNRATAFALLALVEQQRIANLIQLMHVPTGDLSDGIKDALHAAFPNDRDWEAELRDGLGLA